MQLKELILENKTGMEQIALFANLDILVAAHGAGVTNIIFMTPNSFVIELFPPKWQYACYRRLAENMGLLYKKDMAEGELGKECLKNMQNTDCQYRGIRDRDFTPSIDKVLKLVELGIAETFKHKFHKK